KMPQSAHADHGHAFARSSLCVFESAVNGDTCTKQGSGLNRAERFRNWNRMTGSGTHEFRVPAIDHHAGDNALAAQILQAFQAMFADAATCVQPGHADPVS